MNLAFEQLADNPIIDELVFLPSNSERIVSLRACSVMFRKPFIEVEMSNGEVFQRHFPRPSFSEHWAEAHVILETLTRIELISDFRFPQVDDREQLISRVLTCRGECIAEANLMFEEGMYEQFLMQFGQNYAHLPAEVEQRIIEAQGHLGR